MKKLTAAIILSSLLLTACGTDKDDTEQAQTVLASEGITAQDGEGGIIFHGSDAGDAQGSYAGDSGAKQLTSAENADNIPLEETTSSSRTKEEEEKYSRMMGTANCIVTPEIVSVEGEPTLGFVFNSEPAPETDSVELDENAELCLSKLKFGMSRIEAEAAVDAELVEDTLTPFYSIYDDISVDIDEKFDGAMFTYGESGLDEVALYALHLNEEECTALRDRMIKFFSAAYDFSADDWEIDENSDYCKKDGVSFFTKVYLSDGSYSLSLLITSWDHRSFKNQEQYPILP